MRAAIGIFINMFISLCGFSRTTDKKTEGRTRQQITEPREDVYARKEHQKVSKMCILMKWNNYNVDWIVTPQSLMLVANRCASLFGMCTIRGAEMDLKWWTWRESGSELFKLFKYVDFTGFLPNRHQIEIAFGFLAQLFSRVSPKSHYI